MTDSATIMVVDDDDMVASVVSLMLNELGYSSDIINNPHEALEKFTAAPASYDLVLTDLTMPEMNGIELAKQIKDIRSDIIVAVMSGFGGATTSEADGASVDRFLTKPLLLDDLSTALGEMLGR